MANKKDKESHNVNHRYICEHCGELSEWKISAITGQTLEDIFKTEIPQAQKEIEAGNYAVLSALDEKCQKCGRHQSWGLKGSTGFMKKSPLIGLGAAGSLGWVFWFFFGLLGFVAVFVVVTLFFLIFGLVGYIRVTSDMKKTSQRNIPEIKWT